MPDPTTSAPSPPTAVNPPPLARLSAFVWLVAAGHLLLHLVTSRNYGIFRDELYYLACADHLDWGYVDHPPLSIVLLWLQRALLGDSVSAIRVLPALAGAALVVLGAVMARELGGGRFAQVLAAVCVAIAPQYLGITGFFSMNAFDLLLWALAAWLVMRILRTGEERWWLVFGLVAALALLNKLSILFFAAGLAAAVPFTPLKRHLRSRWLWLGAGLALLLFLPHVLWQMAHGWPTREFIANATAEKIVERSPWQFFLAQIPEIHPFNLPVWLLGLGFLLIHRDGRRFRALGIVYLTAFAILALQVSKPYYLGPAYTMLLAAGATAFAAFLEHRRGRRLVQAGVLTVLLAGGALVAPFAVPVLPVETFLAYQRALGVTPSADENHRLGPLPQFFADRFGWQEITAAVAETYQGLTPEERRDVMIVGSNYGEAGAINYFGRRYGLPRAVSQHNSFFLWGPGTGSGNLVILIGVPADNEGLLQTFESVTPASRVESPYAMPYEVANPILVCRGLKVPLAEAWQRGKNFG